MNEQDFYNQEPSLIKTPEPYTGKAPESTYETLRTIVLVLLAAFLIRSFIVQPFVVQGQSMEPTFHGQEYLIVNKIGYRLNEPKRGEIIVFRSPVDLSQNYIKRVVGLPGEKVTIKDTQVFVNEKLLREDYTLAEQTLSGAVGKFSTEIQLGSQEYFVLGDNRDHSSDSRRWGTLPKQNIIGKAVLKIFPPTNFGLITRPNYSS